MTSDSTDPRRVVSIPNSKSGLARACRTNHTQQLWYPWRQELRNAGARRSNGALLRRKHRSILYRNSATPATTASACARTQVRGSARFRACAQPSGALTTVPHITAAKTAGTGCSFGRCQGSCIRLLLAREGRRVCRVQNFLRNQNDRFRKFLGAL